jgi:hypothetical protein
VLGAHSEASTAGTARSWRFSAKKTIMTRRLRLWSLGLLGTLLLGIISWGVLALLYFDHQPHALRAAMAVAYGAASLTAFVAFCTRRWRMRALAAQALLFAVLLWRWQAIEPSNDRDWVPENSRLAHATFDGELVTVHDIRNFDYRTDTDFTPAWYDRLFDLRQLDGVDLVAVYWMGPAIAHVFLSFAFRDGAHLAISIEARKERGEGYSTVHGFFRQYELLYVVADERDVIRLRTNYRHDPPEEVHLYRVRGSPEDIRRLFLQYMEQLNALATRPQFYNSLTSNCTTDAWLNTRVDAGHLPFSWKIVASGYVPEYLFEAGRLDSSLPFDELQQRSVVNARAQAADRASDFSRRIRDEAQPAPRETG